MKAEDRRNLWMLWDESIFLMVFHDPRPYREGLVRMAGRKGKLYQIRAACRDVQLIRD